MVYRPFHTSVAFIRILFIIRFSANVLLRTFVASKSWETFCSLFPLSVASTWFWVSGFLVSK